jgi:hypothetical protein
MYSLVGMSTIKAGMGRLDEALEIEELGGGGAKI